VGEEWRPIFSIGLERVSPGRSLSRTKVRTFRSRGSLPSSSLQMKTMVSAYGPLVMKVLLPFST